MVHLLALTLLLPVAAGDSTAARVCVVFDDPGCGQVLWHHPGVRAPLAHTRGLAAMNLPGRSWLGVAVIAAHNAEEALTAPAWLQPRYPELLQRFGVVPLGVGTERLYVGLTLVTLGAAAWVALASRAAPRSLAAHSLIALYSIFLVNAFIPHVAGSVLLGGYTPGVLSAVTLVVPYCLWYFKRALSEDWVGGAGFVAALAAAGALYVPAVWTLLNFRGW